MNEWLEAIRDPFQEPWKPVGRGGLGVCLGLCAVLVLWSLAVKDPWVPLLDGVNLLFHEAGHPLFGVFGEGPGLYGGTLMQMLVPFVVASHFAWRREPTAVALGLLWACQNLVNIARYAADASAQLLPLVGGGEHDWEGIMLRWGALGHEAAVASSLRALAVVGCLSISVWLIFRYLHPTTPEQ